MFDKILLFCYDSLYEHPVGGYMWASIQTPCTKKSGNGEGEERVVKREGAEQWSKKFLRIFGPETFNSVQALYSIVAQHGLSPRRSFLQVVDPNLHKCHNWGCPNDARRKSIPPVFNRAKLGFTKLRGARFCFFAAPANFLKTWH